MRWKSITWKPNATAEDRVACMAYLLGMDPPPMPSEFFINDKWVDDRESHARP